MIGSHLVRQDTRPADWNVVALTRPQLDLTDFAAVRSRFVNERPDLIIHCAALSQSPQCQADPALARKLNVDVTRFLAELASEARLFFFSTDQVFDGAQGNYKETDRVNPLSVYAETKVDAEKSVLANLNYTVVRTSLNGGVSPTGDRGFNEQLRRAWEAGKAVRLFMDEFRSPLAARVTARAVWELAARKATGIYHLGGSERLSRFAIGEMIAARWQRLHPKIEPASLKEYAGAPRSPDTSLDSSKAQALLSFPLPGLGRWLATNPDEPF